jgi:hypothetical protein
LPKIEALGRGRGKKRTFSISEKVSEGRLSQARQVLRHSQNLAGLTQSILTKSSSFSGFSFIASPGFVGLWIRERHCHRLLPFGLAKLYSMHSATTL